MRSPLPFCLKFLVLVAGIFSGIISFSQTPDAHGIIYVMSEAAGSGDGSSWANATSNLHQAIHVAGVSKVFVAVGTYKVGANSFVMKNGVEIYGGFNPSAGIDDLSDPRIIPRTVNATGGSVLDGQNVRPVLWNYCSSEEPMDNSAVIDGFTLTNGRNGNGGGVYNVYAAPVFRNLLIKNNIATLLGGGIYNEYSAPVIINSIFLKNYSMQGGAIWDETPAMVPMKITNSLFVKNESVYSYITNRGSGIIDTYGDIILKNVTIAENYGYGIFISGGTRTIHNSIVLGGIKVEDGLYEARHSLIEGDASTTNGNINGMPFNRFSLFNNPSAGDYSPRSCSPAINAGDDALYTDPLGTDLAGNVRSVNGIIDLGAYETEKVKGKPDPNGVIYVKTTLSGNGSGDSWANATDNLGAAIHLTDVQQVWVAKGTYSLTTESGIWPWSGAAYTFSSSLQMKSNVAVYGGFDSENGIDDLSDTRILPNPVDLQGSVLTGANLSPVIWNVFTPGTALETTAVLDGFIVMSGNSGTDGGGINNEYASPTLRNLVIRENAANFGAGIFNRNASPVMTNVVLKRNMASVDGGGMYNDASSAPVMTNVMITDNQARYGGGVYNRNSSPKLINTLVRGNTASSGGGGMYSSNTSAPELLNSTIAMNTPDAFASQNSTVSISNSIVYGGTTSGSFTARYSLIENNVNTENGNIDFTGVGMTDVFTNSSSGDFTLKPTSQAINAGSNALYAGLTSQTKDLAGNSRVYDFANGGVIDLGAYESSYAGVIVPDANGIVYVRVGGAGNGKGNSWANATGSLQNAINATGTQKVFVCVGNYDVPSPNSFVMKKDVAIYGGFDPDNGIDDLTDERVLPNRGTAEGSVLNGKNERPVIWNHSTGLSQTSVLDGFTVTGGQTGQGGGGIMNAYVSPSFRNLVIKGNTAYHGGGMFNDNAAPEITNVVISGNSGSSAGGGIFNTDTNSSPVLTNVLITGNNSPIGSGLFFHIVPGAATLNNVTIAGNLSGKAIQVVSGTVNLRNTIVYGQIAGGYAAEYSLVEGSSSASNGNLDAANIGLADVFADPAHGDYRLLACSPVSNKGMADASSLNLPSDDLAGNSRIIGGRVDIGAYESAFVSAVSGISQESGGVSKTQVANGTTDYRNACDEMLVSVSTTGAPGNMEGPASVAVWIDQLQPSQYVKRHYEITPANNAGMATGRVTLYFTQAEFDAFNAINTAKLPTGAGDAEGIARLLVEKRGGTSSDGSGAPNTYLGIVQTIDPVDADVAWNSTYNRWEVHFDVTGFSGFFVKTVQTPLPVRWISFTARLNDNQYSELEWKVDQIDVRSYEIERSGNAKDFTTIGNVSGSSDGVASYRFVDPVPASGTVYYRIRQADLNGSFGFSKIVSVRGLVGIELLAYPNPVREKATIRINAAYRGTTLRLVNGAGVLLQKLVAHEENFTVSLDKYPVGVYILYTFDGKSVKLVKN